MTTASSSFTSSSRAAGTRAATMGAWCLLAVLGLNLAIGLRLGPLLRHPPVDHLFELDDRVARFSAAAQVKVLVFGNSHAQFAMRAPSLGPALGLPADAVFNLSLPGTTAFEAGLHVERWAARFPAARRAFVGVDEVLLTMEPWFSDARIRYLTRFDPRARARYAGYRPDLEHRLTTLAWQPFPLADFAQVLRTSIRQEPKLAATRLVMGDIGWNAFGPSARVAMQPYPWGYPPKPDVDLTNRKERERFYGTRTHAWLAYRAGIFYGAPDAIHRSLEDLEATCRALERRGLAVELVAPVYSTRLRAYLARERQAQSRAFDQALAGYLQASGRSLFRPAPFLDDQAFIDADHLSQAGARRYAQALAQAQPSRRIAQAEPQEGPFDRLAVRCQKGPAAPAHQQAAGGGVGGE